MFLNGITASFGASPHHIGTAIFWEDSLYDASVCHLAIAITIGGVIRQKNASEVWKFSEFYLNFLLWKTSTFIS